MRKLLVLAVMTGLLAACGVKNDLARPDGRQTPKTTPDPSRPPNPIGR